MRVNGHRLFFCKYSTGIFPVSVRKVLKNVLQLLRHTLSQCLSHVFCGGVNHHRDHHSMSLCSKQLQSMSMSMQINNRSIDRKIYVQYRSNKHNKHTRQDTSTLHSKVRLGLLLFLFTRKGRNEARTHAYSIIPVRSILVRYHIRGEENNNTDRQTDRHKTIGNGTRQHQHHGIWMDAAFDFDDTGMDSMFIPVPVRYRQ